MVTGLDALLGDPGAFLRQLAGAMARAGLPADLGPMDHLCYRARDKADYLRLRAALAEHGEPLVEGMIGGRPILTLALHRPLSGPFGPVPCLELAAPKPGRVHHHGLEHGEIVVPDLAALQARYPGVSFDTGGLPHELTLPLPPWQVKFHCTSLADTIAREQAQGLVVPVPADYFG